MKALARNGASRDRAQLFIILGVWAVFAAIALLLTRTGLALDTDSAMRLVEVRDLLHGQSWFDTVQHRMNAPYGVPMHWSRLVDAPLALLMLVSESFALRVWPLALFGAALFLLARIALAAGGRSAAVTVMLLTLLCSETYSLFTPGDIDHHGLQLVLMLAAMLGVIERRAGLTAAAVALGLGVGLESLPYALIAIVAAALWLRDAPAAARRFGLVLAGIALLLLAGATASPYRTTPLCDTYSLFYAVPLMVGGLGVAGIAALGRYRMAALAVLGATVVVLAALLNPSCFAGPYGGMDARLKLLFLARINEARPVWEFFRLAPAQVVGGYVYAIFALVMTALAPPGRARTILLVFGITALAIATFQIRAVPFAILFTLPGPASALTCRLREHSIVFVAAAILVCSSGAFTLAGAFAEGQDRVALRAMRFRDQEDCAGPAAMKLLTSRPPGRVAAFVDQGPAILAATPDTVLAGPYHRDAAGILDTYAIFTGPSPRAILQQRGVTYLMTCSAAPDWDFYRAKGGLVASLARAQRPVWLTLLGAAENVTLYRVSR